MKKIITLVMVLSAFIGNAQRTMFGAQNNYVAPTGPSLPVLVTTTVSDINGTTATSGGTITSDGGEPVTSRGLVWGTSPGSSTYSATAGTGIGAFSTNLTSLNAATTYYVRAFATNSVGTAYGNELSFTSSGAIVSSGLQLHYDTNNAASYSGSGPNLNDLSGNGRHGTLENSPSFTTLAPTAGGGVLSFNGTNQYISTSYTPANTCTISIWFYNNLNYSDFNRGIFSTYHNPNSTNGIYMGTRSPSLNLSRDANVGYATTVVPSLSINTWYNITVTSDASGSSGTGTIKVYLNGNLQTTLTGAKTTHATVLNIGRSRYDANYWSGYLGSAMVYNTALSDTDVLTNYNAQKTRFGY